MPDRAPEEQVVDRLTAVYSGDTVGAQEELFAADAKVKAQQGYSVMDVRTEGDSLVVVYERVRRARGRHDPAEPP